jgi:hypothetical protein
MPAAKNKLTCVSQAKYFASSLTTTILLHPMIKTLISVVFMLILLSACHDQHQEHNKTQGHNAATEPAKTKEDSLYREVIALHDAVMPKMGKLIYPPIYEKGYNCPLF